MAFTPVFDLAPNPLIRVFFSGLLVIKPKPDGSTCEIFVHQIALNHVTSIEVRHKRPNERDLILARILGHLEFADRAPQETTIVHGLLILADHAAGIRGYEGAAKPEGQSFRSAIDLHNLHRGKTAVDAPAGRPSIFMNDGVFYSADITDSDLHVDLLRAGSVVRELTPFAGLIGANIYNTATLVWRQNGIPQIMKLTPLPTGFSYEIYVANDPLFEPPVVPPAEPHDELQEYYKLLTMVPQTERFTLKFRPASPDPAITAITAKAGDRGSSRAPCMSVIDDGG